MNLEEIRYAFKYYRLPLELIYRDDTMEWLENDKAWRESMALDKAIDNLKREINKVMNPIAEAAEKALQEVARVLGGGKNN